MTRQSDPFLTASDGVDILFWSLTFESLGLIPGVTVIKSLPNYFENKITLINQNDIDITYAHKIYSEDRKINFYSNVTNVYNKVRAFSPSAWCIIGNENIKIIKCKKKRVESFPSIIINDKFHLGCNDGLIEPSIVQREGKKPMKIQEFLKGFRFKVGQKINE